jgi:hypothetical protein
MSSIADHDAQRARWRRALARAGLDRDDREDFASTGLAARLANVTTQVLLLPADPETDAVTIDETLATWLQAQQSITLDQIIVSIPGNPRRTAHAIALADSYNETWNSYLAIHRSGAIEFGLGDRGGWDGHDRAGTPIRLISLTPTVARVWAVLRIAAELWAHHDIAGPYQLTVGVRRTRGALLSTLGEGWAEPTDFQNTIGPCPDEHLLWHLELDDPPDHDAARELAYRIGDRLEDAWGSRQRRYLAHRGDFVDQIDARRVN